MKAFASITLKQFIQYPQTMAVIIIIVVLLLVRFAFLSVKYKRRLTDINIEINRAPTHAEREYWEKAKRKLWMIFIFG